MWGCFGLRLCLTDGSKPPKNKFVKYCTLRSADLLMLRSRNLYFFLAVLLNCAEVLRDGHVWWASLSPYNFTFLCIALFG